MLNHFYALKAPQAHLFSSNTFHLHRSATTAITGIRQCDYECRPVCQGFLVEKVALGQVFLQLFQMLPASVIPQMLRTRSHVHHRRYIKSATDSVVKTHTHTLPKLGAYPQNNRSERKANPNPSSIGQEIQGRQKLGSNTQG